LWELRRARTYTREMSTDEEVEFEGTRKAKGMNLKENSEEYYSMMKWV